MRDEISVDQPLILAERYDFYGATEGDEKSLLDFVVTESSGSITLTPS
ncbi:MAG: hypothetical protein OXF06_01525 [Bacteroidetes bacterium]|nr:hypothetical protein [Bacteroidota bacterium]